jgi:hypothetical protein
MLDPEKLQVKLNRLYHDIRITAKDQRNANLRARAGWIVLSALYNFWSKKWSIQKTDVQSSRPPVASTLNTSSRDDILELSSAYPEILFQAESGLPKETELITLSHEEKEPYITLSCDSGVSVYEGNKPLTTYKYPDKFSGDREVVYVLTYNSKTIKVATELKFPDPRKARKAAKSSKRANQESPLQELTEELCSLDIAERQEIGYLTLSSKHLDSDGNVVEDALSVEEKRQWESIKFALREGVRLQFRPI